MLLTPKRDTKDVVFVEFSCIMETYGKTIKSRHQEQGVSLEEDQEANRDQGCCKAGSIEKESASIVNSKKHLGVFFAILKLYGTRKKDLAGNWPYSP